MKNKKMPKAVKILLIVLCVILAVVLCYAAYVFLSYYRVEDNLALTPDNKSEVQPKENEEYSLLSFNIGFGAYEPDFGFFMDGGHESRAFSLERLHANMEAICAFIAEQNPDFCLLQEVDEDGTRTYRLNERALVSEWMKDYSSVWAQNWDCPYLCYPLYSFHGANRSGILTFAKFGMDSAIRRSLPVEDSVMKIVDLDRCYSKTRISLESGKTLVLYNAHLSAYTSDGTIAEEQLKMLLADMNAEYESGNYAICGGDMNKDIPASVSGTESKEHRIETWAQPIPKSLFEGVSIRLLDPTAGAEDLYSCRSADGPIRDDQFRVTVDGFLLSANVKDVSVQIVDTGYRYSDHNPILLHFVLNGEEN